MIKIISFPKSRNYLYNDVSPQGKQILPKLTSKSFYQKLLHVLIQKLEVSND